MFGGVIRMWYVVQFQIDINGKIMFKFYVFLFLIGGFFNDSKVN